MKVQHFIFNWARVTEDVKRMQKSLTDSGYAVNIINCDDNAQDGWINVGNDYWLYGQFYKCLENFDYSNDYLNIMLGDVETDDYSELIKRTIEVVSEVENVGIYAPDYANKEKCWWIVDNVSVERFNKDNVIEFDNNDLIAGTMCDFFYLTVHKDIVKAFSDFISDLLKEYPDFEFWKGHGWGIDLILCSLSHMQNKLIIRDKKISLGHDIDNGHSGSDSSINYEKLINKFYEHMGTESERAQSKIKAILDRCPPHENRTIHTTLEELWK
jgi:hypothetical protein